MMMTMISLSKKKQTNKTKTKRNRLSFLYKQQREEKLTIAIERCRSLDRQASK